MYVDSQLLISDGEDLSQTAGTYYSSYAINLSGVVGDPGSGNPVYVVICMDVALDSSGGAATCVFSVIAEDDTTLDGGSTVIVSTAALTESQLTQGKVIVIPLPAGLITQQYLGLAYTIAGETSTAGTATAFLALQSPLNP